MRLANFGKKLRFFKYAWDVFHNDGEGEEWLSGIRGKDRKSYLRDGGNFGEKLR